jgi:hypothetical protein
LFFWCHYLPPNIIKQIASAIRNIKSNEAPKANGIQSGAVTHHQDHVIVPHSLSIKNTIKRIPDIDPNLIVIFILTKIY